MKIVKLVVVGTLLINLPAIASDKGGNGGFAYTHSIELLKFAQSKVSLELDNPNSMAQLDKDCVANDLAKIGLPQIDLNKAAKILSKVRYNYFGNQLGTDRNGVVQPLMYHYGKDQDGDYVEALQPYFLAYMKKDDENVVTNVQDIKLSLYHEVSHIFSYNEQQANQFEWAMKKIFDSGSCKKH